MNRLDKCLSEARAAGRKVLVPYLVAGDPDHATTVALMHSLVAQGADAIELGMPFSDPSSDGAVIQLGAERALRKGMDLDKVLSIVEAFREKNQDTPVVLMGYLNPIEIMGYEPFAERAGTAGVDGVLIVDMPVSEASDMISLLQPRQISTIFLIAPTTTEKRIAAICDQASGYLYYVSLKGVTGAALTDKGDIAERVSRLRECSGLPIIVGFGIKDSDSALEMARISDGVIVGSALVDRIAKLTEMSVIAQEDIDKATALIGDIRQALDSL